MSEQIEQSTQSKKEDVLSGYIVLYNKLKELKKSHREAEGEYFSALYKYNDKHLENSAVIDDSSEQKMLIETYEKKEEIRKKIQALKKELEQYKKQYNLSSRDIVRERIGNNISVAREKLHIVLDGCNGVICAVGSFAKSVIAIIKKEK